MPNDPKDKVLVCLDAGIATEDNLLRIKVQQELAAEQRRHGGV